MSTQGNLVISKTLTGDCALVNEVDPGDDITYELIIDNSGSEPAVVSVYDMLNPYTMAALSWSAMDMGAGATTGSAGGGAGTIDETITVPPCGKFVYTIIVTTLEPFCGTVTNCARWCTPQMKRPEYVSVDRVYVGMSPDEACLEHGAINLNDALYEFLPDNDRAHIFFDYIEAGYDLVDLIEASAKFIVNSGKPINPDYEGFAEAAEKRAEQEKRLAESEARREEAIKNATEAAGTE